MKEQPNRYSGIKAVTFDVEGTLLRPYPSVGHIYSETAESAGLGRIDAQDLNHSFNLAWKHKTKFEYTQSDWFEIVRATFAGFHCEVTPDFFQTLYDRFAEPEVWEVFGDVIPALETLRKQDLKLAVLSNWDQRLRRILRGLGLDNFFQVVIISGEIGFHKPHPGIFFAAAEALAMHPQTILHVGDKDAEDVLGAETAGFMALKIDRLGTPSKGRVNDLGQIGWLLQNPQEL